MLKKIWFRKIFAFLDIYIEIDSTSVCVYNLSSREGGVTIGMPPNESHNNFMCYYGRDT